MQINALLFCFGDLMNNLKQKYIISNDFAEKCNLEIRYFVKDEEFDEMFYYDKNDLGAAYSKNKTTAYS